MVLNQKLPWVDQFERVQRPAKVPVVFTKEEAREVLTRLNGTARLMAHLLYGSGLRLMECLRLRIKDLDGRDAKLLILIDVALVALVGF